MSLGKNQHSGTKMSSTWAARVSGFFTASLLFKGCVPAPRTSVGRAPVRYPSPADRRFQCSRESRWWYLRRSGGGRPRGAPLPVHEIQVPQVDEDAKALAEDEDRVLDGERVDEQQEPAADREEPEGDRKDAFFRALAGDPLHHETHGEQRLPGIADQHQPGELHEEDV